MTNQKEFSQKYIEFHILELSGLADELQSILLKLELYSTWRKIKNKD